MIVDRLVVIKITQIVVKNLFRLRAQWPRQSMTMLNGLKVQTLAIVYNISYLFGINLVFAYTLLITSKYQIKVYVARQLYVARDYKAYNNDNKKAC